MKKRQIRLTKGIRGTKGGRLRKGRVMDVVERRRQEHTPGGAWVRDDRGVLVPLFVDEFEWVEKGDSQESAPE